MAKLHIVEDQVFYSDYGTDTEKCFHSGYNGPYETRFETTGDLYRSCLREYGRCTGKVLIGNGQQVGWTFLKRASDPEHYDVETWITAYTKPPVKVVEYVGAEYPNFARKSHRVTHTKVAA